MRELWYEFTRKMRELWYEFTRKMRDSNLLSALM